MKKLSNLKIRSVGQTKISLKKVQRNILNFFSEGSENYNDVEKIRGEVAGVRAKLVLVLGPLGSGKTSLVRWILNNRGESLGRLRLIINDVGAENIDAGRLVEDVDLEEGEVSALKSGCICCEDLESLLKEVNKNAMSVDTIVIEPTGIAEGDTIVKALNKLGLNATVVTLVDVLHQAQRTDVEKQIIDTQLAVAKVIGLTWWEKADDRQLGKALEYIGEKNNGAPIIKLPKLDFSERENLGVAEDLDYQQLFTELFDEKADKIKRIKINSRYVHHQHSHEHAHRAPVFSKSFVEINERFSAADLEDLLASYKGILIRAKGVVAGRRFNYVHGDLNWEKAAEEKPVLNFISSKPIAVEEINKLLGVVKRGSLNQVDGVYCVQLEENFNQYLNMDKAAMLNYVDSEVAKLVDQYKQWMRLEAEVGELKSRRPLAIEIEKRIEELKLEQKQLGEAMTFANPLIWLLYKIKAYQGTEKALENLGDLRKHCESPTYICHKRLDYLNWALQKRFGKNLLDDSLDSGLGLAEIVEGGELLELSEDREFMEKWQKYEYFRQVDENKRLRVAKWENYSKKNQN